MHKIQYYEKRFAEIISKPNKEFKKNSFGGSDFHKIINSDKEENYWNEHKICSEVDQDLRIWGFLFQIVAKKIIKWKLGNTIYNFPSIPHPMYPISYSPDGLTLTKDKKDIILIEIKTPIYRDIEKIQERTKLQIYVGMSIFNVDHTVLGQFKYRKCSIDTNPFNSDYDFEYHRDPKPHKNIKPIIFGYLHWDIDCELIDIGKLKCIKDYTRGKFKAYIGEKMKFTRGKVMMWKLMKVRYFKLFPDRTFLDNYNDILWDKYEEFYFK